MRETTLLGVCEWLVMLTKLLKLLIILQRIKDFCQSVQEKINQKIKIENSKKNNVNLNSSLIKD